MIRVSLGKDPHGDHKLHGLKLLFDHGKLRRFLPQLESLLWRTVAPGNLGNIGEGLPPGAVDETLEHSLAIRKAKS